VDTEYDFFTKMTLLLDEMASRRFVLEWASTYTFAVTILRRQRIDLCLISSQIGHRRGGDLVRHLEANHPEIPAILLAGTEEMMEAAEGQPLECLDRHRLTVEMLRQAIRDSLFTPETSPLASARIPHPVGADLDFPTT
jgi:DNA-binding NtrC family response regulator